MRCEDARARMLMADPAALAGRSPGPLAEHLAGCEACAAAAGAILARDAELDTALATLARREAPASILEAAPRGKAATTATSTSPPIEAISAGPLPAHRARLVRRALATMLPLAAAAALAILLLPSPEPEAPAAVPGNDPPGHTVVNAVSGRGVAVMQTRNPDITVVWNF